MDCHCAVVLCWARGKVVFGDAAPITHTAGSDCSKGAALEGCRAGEAGRGDVMDVT